MPIGLYIHVPFCLKKCNYCDFISYPYDAVSAASYVSALSKEIRLYGEQLDTEHKTLSSIYFGGGTPSLLHNKDWDDIFTALNTTFSYDPGVEITVELNPGTADREKLRTLKRLGCNRLSIGVQSLNPTMLQLLGRVHSAQEVDHVFSWSRAEGFDNISLDLIFGLPGQDEADWNTTLSGILGYRPEHISAYNLKIEEGTPFAHMSAIGELKPSEEDLEAAMFLSTIDILRDSGYHHYEISNYCLPGRESAHNINYWENKEYLGLGPAAHSYLGGKRFSNFPTVHEYKVALEMNNFPVGHQEYIDRRTEIGETIFLALRMTRGLNLAKFQQRFGEPLEELFPNALAKLKKLDLIFLDTDYIRLTRKGLLLANEVFAEFV